MERLSVAELSAWRDLVESHRAFVDARMALMRQGPVAELVRAGLDDPAERAAAFSMIPYLDEAGQKSLFPDLLALASYAHGFTEEAVALLAALPRPWVLENIKCYAEPLIQQGSYEEYRMMLRIYDELGAPEFARELAARAAGNADPDIREAGEDFLEAFATRGASCASPGAREGGERGP